MTILEALKATVSYPVSANTVTMILIKRGLTGSDELTQASVNSKEFELAMADLFFHLLGAVNISEGGFSVSIADKKYLSETASGIYSKYGESCPYVSTLTNASDRW